MKSKSFLIAWFLTLAALMLISSRQQAEARKRQHAKAATEIAATTEPATAGEGGPRAAEKPVAPPQTEADRPVYYDDLLLDDPAWRDLEPTDQRDALRRRLKSLPKPRDATDKELVDRESARLHLTIAYLYDTQIPDSLREAANEYDRVGAYLGRYVYAGQAKLRAADIHLELATKTPDPAHPGGDPRELKKARRALDTLSMGILRQEHARGKRVPVELWEKQGDAWVKTPDPYGYVLQRVDQLTRDQFVYRLIDLLVAMTGRIPGWSQAIALIFLAIALKLGMFPLSRKSYRSMAAMQKLQPVVEDLRKRYKDNPQKLNEEMMRVYREHGVNPFAGCLPLVVQIPVFIFVYQGIRAYTFHFHDVPLLWIPSLAKPDLPLLLVYGVSMFVSQKLTMARQPPPADPNQAQMQRTMSLMMPVMFTYMMYMWGLPSAFYLYWLAFNVISTVEQMVIHQSPSERPGEASSGATPPAPLTVVEPEKRTARRGRRAGRARAGKKRRKGRGGRSR